MNVRYKILLFLIAALFSFSVYADQFYGGLGFGTTPGQPNTEEDRFTLSVAYETKDLWRYSFTDAAFQYIGGGGEIKSQILGAERLWVYKIKSGFSLIGAFGPGYYMTEIANSGSGSAIGIVATGSLRFAMSAEIFLEASMHYKNAGVSIGNGSVNGGYQGLFFNVGYFF